MSGLMIATITYFPIVVVSSCAGCRSFLVFFVVVADCDK